MHLVNPQQKTMPKPLLIAYLSFLAIMSLWPFEFCLNGVRWIEGSNGVEFEQSGQAISPHPSQWLYERLLSGSGLSVEVWLQSANDTQSGPARILSYSFNQTMRNFTLGQSEKKLVMRLRTTETNLNGMEPQLELENAIDPSKRQHIAVTYDFVEQCVFIDGERVTCQELPGGTFDNWDPSHFLSVGNEATGDRPWLGEIFFVAIYDRPLSGAEIQEKFAANPAARPGSANANAEFSQGLVAGYLFEEGTGRTIADTSGAAPSLDLHIPRMVKNFDKSYLNGRGLAMPYEIKDLFHDLAHVLAFFPAGFFLHSAMRQRFGGGWRTSAIAFIALTGFAFVLESLQYITLSRHSEAVDFAGRTIGSALGIMADRRFGGSLRKLLPAL